MDCTLAALVRTHMFDFEKVAANLSESMTAMQGQGSNTRTGPDGLTAKQCRLRWAELDAAAPTHPSQSLTSLSQMTQITQSHEECVIKRPISNAVISNAGLTFEELMAKTRGSKSSYLEAPERLPSMEDIDHSKDDGDEDDSDNEVVLSRDQIKRLVINSHAVPSRGGKRTNFGELD
ncbi:unnamed protein product [Chrysoparadoxa australica]